MRFTPYTINVVLHHHCSRADFPLSSTPLYRQIIRELSEHELLYLASDNQYCTTERGKAFVEMLLHTPLPVKQWVDPREGRAP